MSRYIDVDDLVKTIRKNWVAYRDDICQKALAERNDINEKSN